MSTCLRVRPCLHTPVLTFLAFCSRFGIAFEEAALQSRAKAQQRYFDASVVEVRRDDFDKFLKHLSMH